MRSDIVPGATFPDYELPDHQEHQQHLELAAFHPKIAVAYLVLGTPVDRRLWHGPAGDDAADPAGLGPEHARAA